MNRFAPVAIGLTVTLLVGLALLFGPGDDNAEGEAADTTILDSYTTSTERLPGTTEATTSTVPSTSTTLRAPTTTKSSSVTTSPTTSTTARPTTTAPLPPPFSVVVTTPSADQLFASWRPGCPVAVKDLRVLTMTHWGYDGQVRTGNLVVAAIWAAKVGQVFEDLYEAHFPIERMELVEKYGGDDNSSMAANNTSGFNCRQVTGGSSYSEHSYGHAIDINPLVNPYVKGSTVLPPAGAEYVDRSKDAPGLIHAGDEVVSAFNRIGWTWGGTWSSLKDYQHFSATGN